MSLSTSQAIREAFVPNITQLYYDCGSYDITIDVYENIPNSVAYYCGVYYGKGHVNVSNETKITFFDCGTYNITYNSTSVDSYRDSYFCGRDWSRNYKNSAKKLLISNLWMICLGVMIMSCIA